MEQKYISVQCCICKKLGHISDIRSRGEWYLLQGPVDSRTGIPREWWYCSDECRSSNRAILNDVSQRKQIVQWTCDICGVASYLDELNPEFGGRAFAGWFAVNRIPRNATDEDENPSHWHICGLGCFKRLSEQLSA